VLEFPFDSTFGPSTKEIEEKVEEKRLILRKKHCFCKKYSSQRTSFKKKCLSLQRQKIELCHIQENQ
jgi:hypothetical protein